MQLPSRSTLVGGLGGLAVWGLSLILSNLGVPVPQDTVGAVVALVTALLVHFIPDSLKSQAAELNVDLEALAKWLPENKFPD